jgi:hypothetical protein
MGAVGAPKELLHHSNPRVREFLTRGGTEAEGHPT